MAINPYNNKVELSDGTVLMDLTGDTVTPQTMVRGVTAHDRSGASITGVVDLANAGTNTPLADEGSGSVGTSTAYSREDHKHPIRLITYDAATGSFLDWVLTTFTNAYDEVLVNFNTTNYTGWPMQFPGFASIYVINSIVYIVAYQTYGTMWLNTYNGTNWVGWHRIRNSVGVYTYSQTTGNFLDYVVSDIIPAAKASNENDTNSTIIIPFESNNYTGWPKSNRGYATLYVRGNTAYLTAYCRDGSCYTNYYDNPNWVGWTELAKASDIPIAGTSTPLPESPSGSAGSSTAFAKQDHEHPVKTYLYWQQQTDFLPWVVSTFTVNGSYYVVFSNSNTTGLPEDPCNGAAYIYVRNANIFVLLTVNTRNMYLNVYGGAWTGWNKLAKIEDIPNAATSTPAFITGRGSVGSSAKYAREDHSHPGLWYAYINTQSHFLDWVIATFPDNGLYYVLLANGDYTGLPEQAEGVAIIEVRNSAYFIELTTTSGKTYKNFKYGVIWNGWNRLVYESDFVSSSDYVKMPDGTLMQWGGIGSLSFSNQNMITGEKTLPVDFKDTDYRVICTPFSTGVNAYVFRCATSPVDKSKFTWVLATGDSSTVSVTGRGFNWMAIGKWK